MSGTRLFRSDGGAGAVLNLSSARAAAGAPVVKATTQDVFVLTATAAGWRASSTASPVSRRASNSGQRHLRLRAAAAGPLPAAAPSRHEPPAVAPSRRAAPAPPAPVPAAEAAPTLEPTPVADAVPATPAPVPLADVAPAAEEARPELLKKYTVNIEALDNYELLRFIPVTIEPLGERVFVAEAADLNLSITGQTADDAVQLLKELLIRVYEGNRSKRHQLDTERRRQQRTLETYIGRPKGTWHWA